MKSPETSAAPVLPKEINPSASPLSKHFIPKTIEAFFFLLTAKVGSSVFKIYSLVSIISNLFFKSSLIFTFSIVSFGPITTKYKSLSNLLVSITPLKIVSAPLSEPNKSTIIFIITSNINTL